MWCDPAFTDAWSQLEAAFAAASWPEPPAGFVPVGKRRRMRQVLRGRAGALEVAVKWHRPVTRADRVARWLRGGRGPREGRLLRRLRAHAVHVPRPLAYCERSADLLVTAWMEGLEPLPPANTWSRETTDAVAHLLHGVRTAGVLHRDLHRDNVARDRQRLALLDLGGARARFRATARASSDDLARWMRGLLHGTRRTQQLRALHAWWRTAEGGAPGRVAQRAVIERILARERAQRRAFLAGRDRRATRAGRHFATFRTDDGMHGIRRVQHTTEAAIPRAAAWFSAAEPEGEALKQGGRVRLHDAWSTAPSEPSAVVGKWYACPAPGRLAYALRAFRRAEALRNRGLFVPAPLLALVVPGQGSLLVAHAEREARDLHALWHDTSATGWHARSPHVRRASLDALGRWLRRLHESEVSHRDLKAPNLLLDPNTQRIALVDVEGARLRRGSVPWSRRARDLARLAASLPASRAEAGRVLRAYWRVPPRPPIDVRAFRARIDRAVRAKRGPSGLPR